jgi:hypothetical protein
MKTTLLLDDESGPAKLLLRDVAPAKRPLRETEAVAGCNCDRWGHPCPNCIEHNVQPNAEFPSSTRAKQTRSFNAVHQQA